MSTFRENKKIIIWIDGGARGNPGPAGIGVVFTTPEGKVIKEYSEFLGESTNNAAEYEALIFALQKARAIFGKEKIKNIEFEVRSDSQLVVSQMNGTYKIKDPQIQKLFIKAWNLKVDFPRISFVLVARSENKRADNLVNQVLDNSQKKLF